MTNNPRVICIGEILWDCLADQSGDPGEQTWTNYPGGAPANVACALAKLEIPTAFIGCIGGDDLGEKLVENLRSLSINTAGIQRSLKSTTRQVEVLRTEEGDRQFIGFKGFKGSFKSGSTEPLDFADTHLQPQFLPTDLFPPAEFLVLGTLGFAAAETRQALERALDLADQHYLKILMDVNWRPVFWADPDAAKSLILEMIQRVDFLKLSVEEAMWLFDMADAKAIAHLSHLEGVLITHGAKGCTYFLDENEGNLPGFEVEVEDTTGAGDGFVAGFLAQLCHHGLPALHNPAIARQIVTYANAVGAIVTTDVGAIAPQPTAREVEAFFYLNKIRQ
jgi:fructokinase